MATTRLGLYGGPRSPYGSFAGKTEDIVTELERIITLEAKIKDLEDLYYLNLILP